MRTLVEDHVDGADRHGILRAGCHQGADVGAADISLTGSDFGDGVGRTTAAGHSDFQPFVGKEALLDTGIDRGLVATRQPVQLIGNFVGCCGKPAGGHGDDHRQYAGRFLQHR